MVKTGTIKTVCGWALGISRKNIYRKSRLETKDQALAERIRQVHKEHPAYGHKRVALELKINHKRASRVMRKFGIKPPRRKIKRYYTTNSTSNHNYSNLIKGIIPDRANFIFVSDLTYIKFQDRFFYLATIEDIYTREILSAGVSSKHDSTLALSVVKTAVSKHTPDIFHSDQGTEFMAQTTTGFIESKGIKISVSDIASPWQNGYKESFFGRFKDEFGDPGRFETLGELISEIYNQIHYYNHKRIHTALKMPPVVFRQTL